MKSYLETLRNTWENGHEHNDRTGVGRKSTFGVLTRFDISDGTIPLVTTRKIFTRGLIEELVWFIKGSYNTQELEDKNVNIWKPWTVKEEHIQAFASKHSNGDKEFENLIANHSKENYLGTIGQMYGAMWRNAPRSEIHKFWPNVELSDLPSDKLEVWTKDYAELKETSKDDIIDFETFCSYNYYSSVDQLNELVINLKKRPFSSRHVVAAWIPSHVPFETISPQENVLLGRGALAPCHAWFQCFVTPPKEPGGKNRLSLMMTIRSNDYPVGACYNIAQYAILLAMLAHVTDMEPFEYIHSIGDCHIYKNQYEGVQLQLTREPLPAPKLWLNPEIKDLFKFTAADIEIRDYVSHPAIAYPVAI